MKPPPVTNAQLNELAAVSDRFDEEAIRCAAGQAFQAACVMVVASFEARLLATAGFLEQDLRDAGHWPTDPRRADLLSWGLETGLQVARRAGWFEGGEVAAEEIESAVRACQRYRHVCVHPGRLIREGRGAVSGHDFAAVYNIVDEATGALGKALDRSPDPPIGSA